MNIKNKKCNIKQILITGTFRSGTTLIAQILKNHHQINILYDSVNFMRFCYDKYNPITNFKNVRFLVHDIYERIKKRNNLQFNYEEVINSLRNMKLTYGIIYDTLMKNLFRSNKIWGEKTTLVWTKIPDFFKMFPDGGVIHIIRDPRAVLVSWREMTYAPKYEYLDAILNCKDSMEYMVNYTKKYENKFYIPIKYENLVRNPEIVLQKICSKFNLDYDKEMLNVKNFTNNIGEKWLGNSMFYSKFQFISTKLIDIWKEKLEDWEVWLIEFLIQKEMSIFDYNTTNIKISSEQIDQIIQIIKSNELLTDGVINFLFKNKGHERFPTNPLSVI